MLGIALTTSEMSLIVSLPKLGERVKHELDGVRDRDTSKGRVASASTTPRFGVWDPCENPGLQPNDWNKTRHTFRVMLGPSAPGATIVDIDIETAPEVDDQIVPHDCLRHEASGQRQQPPCPPVPGAKRQPTQLNKCLKPAVALFSI